MEANYTESGTVVLKGIEYNEYPPPNHIFKAMEQEWALSFIERGTIRLRELKYYHRLEQQYLGDPNEGKGLFHLNGHPMETRSINQVYVWCLSLPDITPRHLVQIAPEYDCVVKVTDPEDLFLRISSHLRQTYKGYTVHCGTVTYNRGEAVDKATLNSQKFHFNIFQKNDKFKHQLEYRGSVVNFNFERNSLDYLDLEIGSCSDIVKIVELLDNSVK